jgi:hypothetical protein
LIIIYISRAFCGVLQNKKPSGIPLGFTFLKLFFRVTFKLFLNIVFGEKEFAYCEKTCYAENASHSAESIVMVYDDGSRDSHDKNLDGVCRREVDEHSHKLKAYEDGKHVFEINVCGGEIRIYGEELGYLEHDKYNKNGEGKYCDSKFKKSYCGIKKTFELLSHKNLLC